jgi:SPP1 gp7 family putative phage head morphogenesis protein
MDPFKDYNKERLFELIYTGVVTLKKLPKGLFNRTLKHLVNGLIDGIELDYDFKDEVLLKELKTNLYLFSGAKTEVQVMDMIGAMVGENGKVLPFNEFKKIADEKFEKYNKTYLRTEYDTAIGQGQMVSKWDDIMSKKEHFNYLEYDAILDGRTSDLCRHFDGITLPVDDKFWREYSPLNHFNCFTPDTEIEMGFDTPPRKIENIEIGDSVLTNKRRFRKVTFIHKNFFNGQLKRILTGAGRFFVCTGNHPILTTDGWKSAEDLNMSDLLVSQNGLVKILKITDVDYEGYIYNLTVEDDETYTLASDQIIVHNCRCTIHQVSKYDDPISTEKEKVKEAKENADNEGMSDVFKMNPYFDKVVFSKKHPYFEQSQNYKQK